MRLFRALLLLPLLAGPAFAAPRDAAPPAGEHHGRRSMEQHFADANTSRDGRLTLDQAQAGYKSIAKSFAQIDANRRGYVTLDDIRAWKAARKAARQAERQGGGRDGGGRDGGGRASGGSRRGADAGGTAPSAGGAIPAYDPMRPIQVDLPKAPLDVARSS